jgi:probable phosphoglycerate mutase
MLAGFGDRARVVADLAEWDYGDYEGRTTVEIREQQAGWSLWRDGVPGGETARQVGKRADRVLHEVAGLDGDALLFSHGHFLRVLAARWLGLGPEEGRILGPLAAPAIGVLGHDRENRVVAVWNRVAGEV